MNPSIRWLSAALLFAMTANTFAEALFWTVTDGRFQTHVGQIKALTPSELELTRDDGVTESLPMSNILRLSRPTAAKTQLAVESVEPRNGQTLQFNGVPMTIIATSATAVTVQAADGRQSSLVTSAARQLLAVNAARSRRGPLALILANGDILTGEPIGLDAAVLSWKNELVGEIKLPLESARRLVRLPDKQPPATAPADDIASLLNGDDLHGVVSALSSESLTMQPLSGDPVTIASESLKQIRFAQTSQDAVPPKNGFVVGFVDGSRLTTAGIVLTGAGFSLTRLDGSVSSVPAASVMQVEQRGGPVVWLSDLSPAESIQRTFLGRQWPTQFNRTVDGEALTFGSQTFAHGIGVHSFSRLTFDLPGGFDQLHLAYAIQGDAPYADVTVRILLDGQAAHEAAHVHAGALATPPDIAVGGKKQVTFEVDFGDTQDTQDRFQWIEPALLRTSGR